jgi:phosphatidylinositol-3-phosphatase
MADLVVVAGRCCSICLIVFALAGCKRVSEESLLAPAASASALAVASSRSFATSAPPASAFPSTPHSVIQHVFVIAMENRDASEIYGNSADAPYINGTLMTEFAHATSFRDALPLPIPSEPHYVFVESGTSLFPDHTFTTDALPSEENSTGSTSHLVAQIRSSTRGATWRSYQESIDESAGACPIRETDLYAPKHNPFVFFRDVSGDPPSASNAYCAAHHRPYSRFAADLEAGDVASYTFITPDLCHDMHGALECMFSNLVRSGDDWLRAELPRLIHYAVVNAGLVFVEWDEGSRSDLIPFLAIGPGVKKRYAGDRAYDHGSILKSVEEILRLDTLPAVAGKHDLGDLFEAGNFP